MEENKDFIRQNEDDINGMTSILQLISLKYLGNVKNVITNATDLPQTVLSQLETIPQELDNLKILVKATLIDGSVVKRATLHNFDEIQRLDLKINDEVILIKSGDIIPKITKVLSSRRTGNEVDIIRPTNCPKCDSELLDEGILLKCQNLRILLVDAVLCLK